MAILTLACTAFALLSLVNGQLGPEPSKEEIQTRFNEADKDGNEKLSAKEFKELILTLNGEKIDEDDLNYMMPALMSMVDEDGDGMINCNEITKSILGELTEEQMTRRWFSLWDADINGKVTVAELMEFDRIFNDGDEMGGMEWWNELIKIADQDGDGMMTFEEYNSAWAKKKSM